MPKPSLESKLRFYKKVQAVQKIYREHKEEGITDGYIWRKHIKDVFYIGKSTFTRYMTISASREIKTIESQIEEQQS
ncbi:MAG: hypothetical protein AAF242_00165 [Bacteroidota bacterium]